MSDLPQAPTLDEEAFANAVMGALRAHAIEGRLQGILEKAAGNGNGGRPSLIAMPDGKPVQLNVPSAQALCLELIQATRILLQTARITLIVFNDMDTRLRPLLDEAWRSGRPITDQGDQAARRTSTGSSDVYCADTPGKPAPENTGTGPAETQGAKTTTGE